MTIALDTNIILRLITQDDVEQTKRIATALLAGGGVVQDSVLLEMEWVLRKSFGYDRSQIIHAFELLSGMAEITIENSSRLQMAVDGYRKGLDFTDAFHLAGAIDHASFMTFDKDLLRLGPKIFSQPVLVKP